MFILLMGGGILLVWRVFRIFRPEICVFLRVRGAEFCDGIFEGTESLKAYRRCGKKDTFELSR